MIRETLSKESYLTTIKRRSQNTYYSHNTAINTFESFLFETNSDLKEPLNTLNQFVTWLETQGKSPASIINYTHNIKKYLRVCKGIRIDLDDFKDFVGLPQVINQEMEPFTKTEARLILENIKNQRRKSLYWFILSTGCRISESLQVKVKNIDFEKNPVLVTLPASIVKGKKRIRYQYLTKESTPLIRSLCRDKNPEDLVFTDNPNENTAKNNEEKAWIRLIESENVGLTEKYTHNNRYKKNFHSMRAFVSSQIYNHTNDAEYAHAYLGHDTYLNQYLRKSPEDRSKMFTQVEPALTIFGEVNTKSTGMEAMQEQIDFLVEEVKNLKEVEKGAKQKARFGDKITVTDLRDIEN